MYWNDFENMARKVGFSDPRLVEDAPITVENGDVERLISETGNDALEFFSATYRLWNVDLEPYCEDYGQAGKSLDVVAFVVVVVIGNR
jgi:hypothetical protein